MDGLLFFVARGFLALIQALPLGWVARLGRAAGALAYVVDARHRRVAARNLARCFGGEKSPAELRALARENFRRIGENFACAAKTASMSFDELRPHVEFVTPHLAATPNQPGRRMVAAIGHFGNFELYARFGQFAPGFRCATTYRGLRQPSVDRLFQSLRERSGCQYFERRTQADALKNFMNQPGVLLGLLSDQAAGDKSPSLPFLGGDCATSLAPAIFALRYDCSLITGICYRTGLARWRIETGDEIPTRQDGQPRSPEDIMRDVNRALETAVRRDPANWFWVHDRWKARRARPGAHHPGSAKTNLSIPGVDVKSG